MSKKQETSVTQKNTFTVKGEQIPLKPYTLENQAFFLPFQKMKAVDSHKLKAEKTEISHVIYNNTLFILAGGSQVKITSPSFGDTEVRYLDDTTPEPVYDSVTVLVNSVLDIMTDSCLEGNNYLEHSNITVENGACVLVESTIVESIIYATTLSLMGCSLTGTMLYAKEVIGRHSQCRASNISAKKTISIVNSPLLRNICIGLCKDNFDEQEIRSISILVPVLLDGSDNRLNFDFEKPDDGELDITIESRMDFSPITAINGLTFPTARAGKQGIVVGSLFIAHEKENVAFNKDDIDELTDLLFGDAIAEEDLSFAQKMIVENFINTIESRLAVYKAIDHYYN